MKWVLALHTVTPTLGLALLPIDSGIGSGHSQCWILGRQMAQQLHPHLAVFLGSTDLSSVVGVGVAVGPGSFTGARLGVTVARTLGQSLGIPVYGISSLAAIAQQVQAPLVAVAMDAQRGEWFGGFYRQSHAGVEAWIPDQLWTDPLWQEQLALHLPDQTLNAMDFTDPVPVLALGELALHLYQQGIRPAWETVLPFYGRKPPIS